MANVKATESCISQCRVKTLKDKKVTDATLGAFQTCVDQCRFTQDVHSLLNDIRGMTQAASSLFKHWAETAIACAPIEEPVRVCQGNLSHLMFRYYMDTAAMSSSPATMAKYCAGIVRTFSQGVTWVIPNGNFCGGE